MESIIQYLWLIPTAPLLAAGAGALLPRRRRRLSAGLAIGAISISFLLSCAAFWATLHSGRATSNFRWFDFGTTSVQMGWVLDPLGAIMAVMVALVSLLIFIYSLGYMAKDENFTRFFCFLALFAAAMLGLVIANSLLLFFMCWELVGLASYLLIGFWFQKPSAAAAAKKAFIVTRIGDLGFLVGMLWLYAKAGTHLFYDHGQGCLEPAAAGGLVASTAIALLIFCGAVGKSGQIPLHVWLPDAMEGPTPVSALIHAATMVAAGVFLIARVYPLMTPGALQVVTWVGALTAVFAASIAVAQSDIKRILAYSTVSQLGYMMMGLGAGGVAVGMFHLTTHAFFKALLFLGAGSVIHGCHEEQDIRKMGGLRLRLPVTFATYAVGMMALSGVPLFFSGFWSKDAILDALHHWGVSDGLLYDAPGLPGVFGQTHDGGGGARARKPSRHDRSAADSGGFGRDGRVFWDAGVAVVPGLFGRRLGGIRFVKTNERASAAGHASVHRPGGRRHRLERVDLWPGVGPAGAGSGPAGSGPARPLCLRPKEILRGRVLRRHRRALDDGVCEVLRLA
jgi:NADH-quinone oxidoreductase subunit L